MSENKKLYHQAGQVGIYQIARPFLTVADCGPYLDTSYGEMFGHLEDGYANILFYEHSMEAVAKEFLRVAAGGVPQNWLEHWRRIDEAQAQIARSIANTDVGECSNEELRELYDKMYATDNEMWRISIFIDAFDPGFDQIEMKRIADEYGVALEDAAILATPSQLSYLTQWEQAVYDVAQGERSRDELKDEFFWIRTTYSTYEELTDEYINEEVENAVAPTVESVESKQKELLNKYNLSHNPFDVFQELSAWRDERKRLNHTGIYGLSRILAEVLRRQGMDASYINVLVPYQADELFAGTLKRSKLDDQQRHGVHLHITPTGEYSYLFGTEGVGVWEKIWEKYESGVSDTVEGITASRGRAQGKVRIVKKPNDEAGKSFQEGDILVTVMTRPEFLPLMKKAAAIITNEGGITSHAAIVSRELGKPCIIGTGNAMKVLKDGDEVEVDADGGGVKIIKHAEKKI